MSEPIRPPQSPAQTAIRPAQPHDAAVLAALRYEFRASVGQPVEPREEFLERCQRWMRAQLEVGSPWRCWLAEEDGEVLGHLWLQSIDKIPNPVDEPEAHAYVTNVYVRPEARKRGIGARLLEAALDWCRSRDVDSVILWPTERSRPLYQRQGFQARNRLMELDVARRGRRSH